MNEKRKRYALFIGRWQPFHNGHKYIIDEALKKREEVCVAIRDTEISESDPYTAHEREEMIRRVYKDKIKVIVIPDIKSINIGRKVGYDINRVDPPEHITAISGTNVRKGKDDNIPKEVSEYIKLLRTTFWITGLPCSGKTTLAKRLKDLLKNKGYKAIHLDGDDVRNGLNKDLSFSNEDRLENLRRIAHVAKLFNDNGNIVIASFISPTNEMRGMVKNIIGDLKLIYTKCSLKTCEARDVKGMYKKARNGEIKDFTGVSAPFEDPQADIVVDTEINDIETCMRELLIKGMF